MKITELLNLKWNYQMTESLMALLFDKGKRVEAFDRYLATNPDLTQDCFLAEFQESFAERSNLKQDYTPSSICQIIASISGEGEKVLDVCCGTGALTIGKWAKNPDSFFYLEEFSKEAIAILLFNLSVRGINAEVRHCDVLTGETFTGYRLTRTGKYSEIEQVDLDWSNLSADIVISNPPYSASWEPKQDERFEQFGLAPKSKADFAFLLHGLHFLKDNGEAYFILPHGVLFRGQNEEKIRTALIEKNYLDVVIGLPEKLFLATDIPVAILGFKKSKLDKDIYFMAAEDLFIKQKPKNVMTDEHINQVVTAYGLRRNIDKLSQLVEISQIQENGYNLNIPRYVDKSEPENIPDLLKEAKELLEISKELDKAQSQFLELLEQLEVTAGSKKEKQEFEQAKEILRQVFAPRQYKTGVIKKISSLSNENYQATLFNEEEIEELSGFIEIQEKKIEQLKKLKQYFLAKMFPR